MQLWALIVDSLRETRDRKIFWVVLAMSGVIALAMASVRFDGDRVSLLFGFWERSADYYNPLRSTGRSALIGGVVYLLLMFALGWVGIILTVIATAGFFPTMMERGTIDVLLSKPISRPRLFLYKYMAGMLFVLIQATVFVSLTFLIMGWRWGIWVPGYLISIPLLVLLFSYVYCVSVLVAVKTRSSMAAILLSLAAWFLYACPTTVLSLFHTYPELQKREQLHQAIRVLAWIPPKTGDIPYLAARWSQAGSSLDMFPEEFMQSAGPSEREQFDRARDMEEQELKKNPWVSIGSSLLFEAIIVLWGMWVFTRQDH